MNRTAVFASAGVALLGFLLLSVYVRQVRLEVTGGPLAEVLIMRRDAHRGEPVTEELLLVGSMPEAYVEPRHIAAEDLPRVVGVRLGVDARANQALLWTDLTTATRENVTLASRVPKGMRAIAIPRTESNAFGGLLRPGDRVDVLLTRSRSGTDSSIVTVPLLQNLLVLSVGGNVRSVGELQDDRRGGVSLLISIDQAALLVQAQRGGELRLVLRNHDDVEISSHVDETTDLDVLEQEARARRQQKVRLERVN
ncbi:MAG: Flp pilus assembly protein CpaB [Polyangiales bacterium]